MSSYPLLREYWCIDLKGGIESTSYNTGTIIIDGGIGCSGNSNIQGDLTVQGNIVSTGGTITLGEIDTDIIPNTSNTFDLGSGVKKWKDIHIDGTGYIDAVNSNTIDISGTSTLNSTVNITNREIHLGEPTVDNSWKLAVDNDDNLVISKRESGNWIIKHLFS